MNQSTTSFITAESSKVIKTLGAGTDGCVCNVVGTSTRTPPPLGKYLKIHQ